MLLRLFYQRGARLSGTIYIWVNPFGETMLGRSRWTKMVEAEPFMRSLPPIRKNALMLENYFDAYDMEHI